MRWHSTVNIGLFFALFFFLLLFFEILFNAPPEPRILTVTENKPAAIFVFASQRDSLVATARTVVFFSESFYNIPLKDGQKLEQSTGLRVVYLRAQQFGPRAFTLLNGKFSFICTLATIELFKRPHENVPPPPACAVDCSNKQITLLGSSYAA